MISHDTNLSKESKSFKQIAKPQYRTMELARLNNLRQFLDISSQAIEDAFNHTAQGQFHLSHKYSNQDYFTDLLPFLGIMNQVNSPLLSKCFKGISLFMVDEERIFLSKMCDYERQEKPELIFESGLKEALENDIKSKPKSFHWNPKSSLSTSSSAPVAFMEKLQAIKSTSGWNGLSLSNDEIVE